MENRATPTQSCLNIAWTVGTGPFWHNNAFNVTFNFQPKIVCVRVNSPCTRSPQMMFPLWCQKWLSLMNLAIGSWTKSTHLPQCQQHRHMLHTPCAHFIVMTLGQSWCYNIVAMKSGVWSVTSIFSSWRIELHRKTYKLKSHAVVGVSPKLVHSFKTSEHDASYIELKVDALNIVALNDEGHASHASLNLQRMTWIDNWMKKNWELRCIEWYIE